MQNNSNNTSTILGGLLTAGLLGVSAVIWRKLAKEERETEELLERSRKIREQHEAFMQSWCDYQDQMAEASQPIGEYLDECAKWFEEQDALVTSKEEP